MFLLKIKKFFNRQSSGFTLIELMVTLSISTILLGIGSVKYIDFNKTQTIKAVGQTFKNNIRDAQNDAMSGVKPAGCTKLNGYKLTITDSVEYKIQAYCNIGETANLKTFTLPKDLYIVSPSVDREIYFYGMGKGTYSVSFPQIVIQNFSTSPNKYYALCISMSGDIKDCGYSEGSFPSCTCEGF